MNHEELKKGDAALLWIGGIDRGKNPFYIILKEDPWGDESKNAWYVRAGEGDATGGSLGVFPLDWLQPVPSRKSLPDFKYSHDEELIPFDLAGSLEAFEEKFLPQLNQIIIDASITTPRTLLASVWAFGNLCWSAGFMKVQAEEKPEEAIVPE